MLQIAWSNISSLRFNKFCLHQSSGRGDCCSKPFGAHNEVLFIIVGFADHPVSNVPRSQPLNFYRQKLCKIIFASLKNLFSVICGFRIPDSGFRLGFRFHITLSGFLVLGLPFISSLYASISVVRPNFSTNPLHILLIYKQTTECISKRAREALLSNIEMPKKFSACQSI